MNTFLSATQTDPGLLPLGFGTGCPLGRAGVCRVHHAGACYTWPQVNDGGFGIGVGTGAKPFDGEEGFEVTVYDGRLYVGMEADNTLGARLWRTTDANEPAGQSSRLGRSDRRLSG